MKRVCLICVYHTLSDDGSCIPCQQGYMQDESITLVCEHHDAHGCREWAKKCASFTVAHCPDHCKGPYDIWDNLPCTKRSPNEIYCNNVNSDYFGAHCIEELKPWLKH